MYSIHYLHTHRYAHIYALPHRAMHYLYTYIPTHIHARTQVCICSCIVTYSYIIYTNYPCIPTHTLTHTHARTGMHIYVHGCAATPLKLLDALAIHGKESNLRDVKLTHIHTEGPGILAMPEFQGRYPLTSILNPTQ